jgi:hypothetical protein
MPNELGHIDPFEEGFMIAALTERHNKQVRNAVL